MKNLYRNLFMILLGIASLNSIQAQNPLKNNAESEYFPGEVLVQIRSGFTIDQIIRSFPENIQLKTISELSPMMRVWHLSFDHSQISHADLLEKLWQHRGIRLAQNNHIIEERATMPNDPNTAANQWHHNNTGQTGGTVDADIDSDLAWDITTGGLTVQGDTIVVCIVEGGGAMYTHPDLIGNFWRNYQEIANNGIDDDGNGYIDDRDGWRVDNSTDNHATGGHGTQCMGMIGAKGDNSLGVVGANWNVKMMLVSGFSTAESSVISAYSYPLKMRKMYNDSNGANGAFVVATSASWGIDNADPTNYPLWCAMYDTLGKYGILNPASTTNNTANVDAVGDMPTACASDYMISVTRTSATDSQAGGYGATTIDFGAPGINVYTTSGTNSYGNTTGTSFSCPLTAGVIGLLYSVPCNSLIALAKTNPQLAADQVRMALMNGVDLTSAMNGISVTGGRLNAFNSVNEILNNCSTNNCITPFSLAVSGITDIDATFTWSNGGGSDFIFYIREAGANTWDSTTISGTSYNLGNLTGCTDYEFMVRAICPPTDTSGYSAIFSFSTDGCCVAPSNVTATVLSNTSASIDFNDVLASTSYNVLYKPASSNIWSMMNTTTLPLVIAGLDSCTTYDLQVQTVCGTDSTSYTSIITFTTTGCGFCESNSYCAASGNASTGEWIANVNLNTINFTSGNDGGYLFSGASTDLYAGQTYSIALTPGFDGGSAYDEQFVVWIDYNGNAAFDTNEEVYNSGVVTSVTSGNITIPSGITEGLSRMRVSMKFVGGSSTTAPTACVSFAYGEVEDYCVNLIDTVSSNSLDENGVSVIYQVYPNPASQQITFDILNYRDFDGQHSLEITNTLGELVYQGKITQAMTHLPTQDWADGIYYYSIDLNGFNRKGKLIIQK